MGILQGKTAIVVGANSGIGYGCALRFVEEGAEVLACDIREDGLEKLVERTRGLQGRLVPMTGDIAREEDLDRMVATTLAEFGKVEILACIAQGGMNHPAGLLDTTADLALESYITGPLYTLRLIQKCVPHMKQQHYGRIITCASGSAVSGTPGFTGYAMAKGAIMSLTRSAAKELGQFGITTNCFLPVIKGANFDASPEGKAAAEQIARMSPLGYFGDAYEDCSPILTFMASEASHYMNGQMIGICSGIQMLA